MTRNGEEKIIRDKKKDGREAEEKNFKGGVRGLTSRGLGGRGDSRSADSIT